MIQPGSKLAHYEIVSAVGKGGMGEVWRARDTKLGREVAIKALPDEFAADADRLARFEREAKLLASLNHPNIAAIHGFEEDNGTHFLVMELVEGNTLADRLERGAIPIGESLKLALQIAEALEAAHEKGVIHRDLKPANIKVTPDGKVKVLDFGLAKAFIGDAADVDSRNSPTLSMAATAQGFVLGTAAYMSPEQAGGEIADNRSDVWAFGVVFFEMLTGVRLFDGKTVPHILAGVLRSDPDWARLPPGLPSRIRFLLERCLEKEVRDRCPTISEARVEIRRAQSERDVPELSAPSVRSEDRRRLAIAAAILGLVLGGVIVWLVKPEPVVENGVVRFDHVLPEGRTFRNTGRPTIAIAPDGGRFVYNGTGGLYLRQIDQAEDRLIVGTEGALTSPTFSPDGEWIAYWDVARASLVKIPSNGGVAVTLAPVPSNPLGISWEQDDAIVFASPSGIHRVSAGGGEPETMVSDITDVPNSPQLLPDGETVLFTITGPDRIALQRIGSDDRRILFPGRFASYLPSGHLVYFIDNDLYAVGFDLATMETTGGPVGLVENVVGASFSANGSAVFISNLFDSGTGTEGVLTFVDHDGTREPLDIPPADYRHPRLSPDGQQIAVEIRDEQGGSIWIYDIGTGRAIRRLTQAGDGSENTRPVWTLDGESITFSSNRDGPASIYRQRADGSQVAERLTTADEGTVHVPESWSPDGTLSFGVIAGGLGPAAWSIWTMSPDGEQELFRDDPNWNEFGSAFSPDGNYVAYSTNAGGGIYVQPFPPSGVTYEVVGARGGWPIWAPDGSEMFYRFVEVTALGRGILYRVGIETDPAFSTTPEVETPVSGFSFFTNYRDFDIDPNGDRFLMIFPAGTADDEMEPPEPTVRVVLNWHQELLERVPVD